MTFGEKLQELRKRARMSQSQLAAASGVPVWTIRGYEQGRREPLWLAFLKLADALGIDCRPFAEFAECVNGDVERPEAKARRASPAAPKKPRGRPRKGSDPGQQRTAAGPTARV
jgi:transcriptional regulator with XRE-family HTH domain